MKMWIIPGHSLYLLGSEPQLLHFCSFLPPVIINTHTISVFTQHIEIHMLAISSITLSHFGTTLLCLLFLSPCDMLTTMHFLPHLGQLCNLFDCCSESLPLPLPSSHPGAALSSNQNLFSLMKNHTVPDSSFDHLFFFIMCCWSTLSPGNWSS